jgi:CRP-like cAMP-binding protein
MVEVGHFTEAFIRKIDIVSAGSIHRRMAALLAMLIERHGVSTGDNAACLPYKLTLAQIGGIADARIETVARVLSQWKKQGWLAVDTEGFHILELDRLHALTGD